MKSGLLPPFQYQRSKELPHCRRMCEWKSSHRSSLHPRFTVLDGGGGWVCEDGRRTEMELPDLAAYMPFPHKAINSFLSGYLPSSCQHDCQALCDLLWLIDHAGEHGSCSASFADTAENKFSPAWDGRIPWLLSSLFFLKGICYEILMLNISK